jgi:hypothetical protein
LAGPVKADVLLREARWVVETTKLAALDGIQSETRLRVFWQKAHADRLASEHQASFKQLRRSRIPLHESNLNNAGRVHLLLASAALPKLGQVYKLVFEKILNEHVSTAPVVRTGV